MAQDSKRKRHLRRLKRQNTLLSRMLDLMIKERNAYRAIVVRAREQAIQEILEKSKKDETVAKNLLEGEIVPAIYDPEHYPEGAARADAYIAEQNEKERAE